MPLRTAAVGAKCRCCGETLGFRNATRRVLGKQTVYEGSSRKPSISRRSLQHTYHHFRSSASQITFPILSRQRMLRISVAYSTSTLTECRRTHVSTPRKMSPTSTFCSGTTAVADGGINKKATLATFPPRRRGPAREMEGNAPNLSYSQCLSFGSFGRF